MKNWGWLNEEKGEEKEKERNAVDVLLFGKRRLYHDLRMTRIGHG